MQALKREDLDQVGGGISLIKGLVAIATGGTSLLADEGTRVVRSSNVRTAVQRLEFDSLVGSVLVGSPSARATAATGTVIVGASRLLRR